MADATITVIGIAAAGVSSGIFPGNYIFAGTLAVNGAFTLSSLGTGGGLVSVGAADSGGVGFKLLRVPN